jgi:DNA-binding transcriptional LysR family regulator
VGGLSHIVFNAIIGTVTGNRITKGDLAMELKQIQYFEAVRRRKSFSKAAGDLLLTQQCISKNIHNLEQELGTPLFIRSSSGVELTEEGRYFHEQAAVIVQTQDEILKHFSEIRNHKKSSLKIGISHGLGIFFNENFFQEFQQKYPEIDLQITELWNPQTEENVLNRTIDAGFTLAPVKYPELGTVHVHKEPLYCIVNENHRFADRATLDIEEILDEKIIMADENYNSFHNFQKICEEHGKHPITVKTCDLMPIYDYVVHSNVVGFTLKTYSRILQYQNIRHIPLTDPDAFWDICLVYRNGSKKPPVTKFVQYIREYKKEG